MLAQISAATTAASRTPALPDSVRRNERSGPARSRAQTVRPRQTDAAAPASSATTARETICA